VNNPPVLSDASVTPISGGVGGIFNCEVKYYDENGEAPQQLTLYILLNGSPLFNAPMHCFALSETQYSCSYNEQLNDPGYYEFFFNATSSRGFYVEYHCEDQGFTQCHGPTVAV